MESTLGKDTANSLEISKVLEDYINLGDKAAVDCKD